MVTTSTDYRPLTQAWTQLRYHEQQTQMWRSGARFIAAACGRGSGKTELARRRVVRMLPVRKPWSRPMYFYALPTYKQARRVAWRNILDLIPPDWHAKDPNETEMRIVTRFGSELYVVGLDKPQRIEGDQWDGGIVDESSDQRPGVFDRSILPALSHKNGWCWRIGVPKRFGIGAAEYKNWFFKGLEAGYGGEHESYTWTSETVLTEEQLRWARENLDPRDYNEQYGARWENAAGLVFYAFDKVVNVKEFDYDPNLPLIIGSDFNVNPMAWAICQRPAERELRVLDELWIRNTNTRETLDELYRRYGSTHKAGFEFYGDASSRARNTRASDSDYVQIKNDKRFRGAKVFYPKKNPARKNRFAACNAMLRNAEGEVGCVVHRRCTHLIRDLENRAYDEDTGEPDDGQDVGHITDGWGYVIHRLWPLRYETGFKAQVGMF